MNEKKKISPVLRASIVLGLGLGGFIDGIVLHQILQWHQMVSAEYPPNTLENMQLNNFWDGLFHMGTLILTAVGLALMWRALQDRRDRLPGRLLVGGLLLGWGLFNLVEGTLNHFILGIHHVRPGPNQLAYDLAFLALGAVLMLVGWWLARDATRERAA
jgi:uncharacterized membrane protein